MDQLAEKIKVLYVDDEEGNLLAFRASFRREFDVQVCTSPTDALAWLEKNPVHVVISDQRMPGMTGSEFLSVVRTRWPNSVRLLLTGYADIQAVVEAINLGGIHAYITKPWDPTDLKLRIEQAYEVHFLRAQRDRLFERYRQVFDASGDPIVILDDKGVFRELNPAAEQLFQLEQGPSAPMQVDAFVEDLPTVLARFRAKRKGTTFKNVDLTLGIPHGSTVDCLVTVSLVGRDADGTRLYQAMIKDITDRKKEEDHLRKLNHDLDRRVAVRTKQLMEALDDLGAFSYSVAHDLRSPLKNIKAMSDHLGNMAGMRGDAEERDLSERIHKGAARLLSLVDDLLRFSRTDSKDAELVWLDAAELMQECIREFPMPVDHIRFQLPETGVAMVHADRAMAKVALNNLLANAVKFTRMKPEARIELGYAQDGDGDLLWVTDNGVGFDSQKKDQVFGMFKRLHSAAQFEGTGIGLALVDRIMKKHNGRCWAEGAPDQGATIHLCFPAKQPELRQVG
ncbi:MAG: response regulator [Flavobacteriales bacterium]|nr:response regulator [Flavobacteriales bacterium]MBP9081217.1 response regulator [Flavobacteriales bacterium]